MELPESSTSTVKRAPSPSNCDGLAAEGSLSGLKTPCLQLDGVSYTYPGEEAPALTDISLNVYRGECICITGPSGCGKTTLLLAIQGLLKDGTRKGVIEIVPTEKGAEAGMVFQNAETQILCPMVEDEVAFGLDNRELQTDEITIRVHSALQAVGLLGYEKRNVDDLSAGEMHRLTIASVLSLDPQIMLLDEPTGQLDAPGKQDLTRILGELKGKGHTLFIADHDLRPYTGVADRYVVMEKGEIAEICQTIPSPYVPPDADKPSSEKSTPKEENSLAIEVHDLCVAGLDGRDVLQGIDLGIYRGELVFLFGHNGAGKSTLLRCLAGIKTPRAGSLTVAGINPFQVPHLLGKIGFLFQNPHRQLFEETVEAEVGFSLKRRRGLAPQEIYERVREMLSLCSIFHLAARSPLTLSFGEQHRVAIASVLASRPEVLLLDEPFAGLDFEQRYRVLQILREYRSRYGTTVVIASHDSLPDSKWEDRSLAIRDGRIFQN